MHLGVLSGQFPSTGGFVVYWRAGLSQKVMTGRGMGGFVLVQLGLYIQTLNLAHNEHSDCATGPPADNTFSYPAPLDSTDF